jgi:hypothetical protein
LQLKLIPHLALIVIIGGENTGHLVIGDRTTITLNKIRNRAENGKKTPRICKKLAHRDLYTELFEL